LGGGKFQKVEQMFAESQHFTPPINHSDLQPAIGEKDEERVRKMKKE